MNDDQFHATIAEHAATDMTVADQRKAGTPIAGDVEEEHRNFLKNLFALIDSGAVDVYDQESFLNEDVYNHLDEEWREKVDIALANIAHQLRLIQEFREHEDTPEESPQLQTMVEQLWQMKQRIEIDEDHDVFKF